MAKSKIKKPKGDMEITINSLIHLLMADNLLTTEISLNGKIKKAAINKIPLSTKIVLRAIKNRLIEIANGQGLTITWRLTAKGRRYFKPRVLIPSFWEIKKPSDAKTHSHES